MFYNVLDLTRNLLLVYKVTTQCKSIEFFHDHYINYPKYSQIKWSKSMQKSDVCRICKMYVIYISLIHFG